MAPKMDMCPPKTFIKKKKKLSYGIENKPIWLQFAVGVIASSPRIFLCGVSCCVSQHLLLLSVDSAGRI